MMLALDPLLVDPGWSALWITLLKVVVAFAFLLVAVMLQIWFMRKVISDFQNRIGPSIAGPWGSSRRSPTG
ncbi:MAG: NADH-quinone oxidoreductase subunit H [Acidimicrobiales bacterium]